MSRCVNGWKSMRRRVADRSVFYKFFQELIESAGKAQNVLSINAEQRVIAEKISSG